MFQHVASAARNGIRRLGRSADHHDDRVIFGLAGDVSDILFARIRRPHGHEKFPRDGPDVAQARGELMHHKAGKLFTESRGVRHEWAQRSHPNDAYIHGKIRNDFLTNQAVNGASNEHIPNETIK